MKGNCQVNDAVSKCDVTRPLPKKVYLGLAREKCILDLQWENGRYVSTTTSYHLNTGDIPVRQHFEVICGT